MDLTKIKIQTERLLLVPVTSTYIPSIHKEYRLPLTKYMHYTSTGSLKELEKRHASWRKEMRDGTKLFVAVLKRESREFLGCFGLEDLGSTTPEMGGWLKKSAHSKGYGKEAAAGIKNWADKNIEYEHILWPCAVKNITSRKLAKSLGGTIKKRYVKKTASGTTWPAVQYWIPKQKTKLPKG